MRPGIRASIAIDNVTTSPDPRVVIGTAGWSIAAPARDSFPAEGTALERYAARFDGVEINSSFHRPHRRSTWERWAASVPSGFRFAVKLPKTISHKAKLVDCAPLLGPFLDEVEGLGDKLAILLLQLPPSFAFDAPLVEAFLDSLQPPIGARLVCEPRHPSWFEQPADAFLASREVARVAADPAPVPAAALPGGWRGLGYWRLHGSPSMYRSSYECDRLEHYSGLIRAELASGRETWCMFDNTAGSAATGNALSLMRRLESGMTGPG
jgi:uncharacterized protein YecE (DUF72 family)